MVEKRPLDAYTPYHHYQIEKNNTVEIIVLFDYIPFVGNSLLYSPNIKVFTMCIIYWTKIIVVGLCNVIIK